MSKRKPKIEYYWSTHRVLEGSRAVVNWRLVGANGETMCQSMQGFRDKTDAQRSVEAVATAFAVKAPWQPVPDDLREVGPGRKPT